MTNFQRWQLICRDLSSPQSFIDFGFYSLISAALQRRVWVGPAHTPLFPNTYTVLCGEPAIGKGIVLKRIYDLLSFHKRFHRGEQELPDPNDKSPVYAPSKGTKAINEDPLVIPIGSDSTTWQGLVHEMMEAYDAIRVPEYTEDGVKRTTYHHCSLAYCIEELSTLFQKNTETTANFFLKAYDCEDYRYRTVGRKVDLIKKTCMNFLAGTTPSFMQETFDDKILNEGFSSRCWYICADKNREDIMFFREWDMEQKVARMELLVHIKNLTSLYGSVSYTEEAYKFLEKWWPDFRAGKLGRANNNPKLNAYYGRLKVHVQKMALDIHFGEHSTMKYPIELWEVKKALATLMEAEKNMHMALTFKASNPQAVAGRKLLQFLSNKGRATKIECQVELHDYIDPAQVEDLIAFYMTCGKIEQMADKEKNIMYYSIKKV